MTSEGDPFKRKDFLWRTDRNQWHNQRSIEMRKKYGKEISALEGNDPWTFLEFCFMSISHWTLAVIVGYYFSNNYWMVAFIGWGLGGYWAVAAGLAIHEASHQLVFTGRWGAFFAGFVGEMPCFLPAYPTFLHYHMPHHAYISINLDKTNKDLMEKHHKKKPMYDPDLPTAFEGWLFSQNMATRILFLIFQVLLYALRPYFTAPRTIKLEDVIGAFGQVLYIGSAYYLVGGGAPLYLACASFLGQGFHVAAIHFIAEHYAITEDTAYQNDPKKVTDTFSYYGPMNSILYNGGYHVEHHDFPRIPYRKLPVLRKMCAEYYDTIPHHMSYFEVMFRFIFNHPGLYQRLKRKFEE